MGGSSGGYEKKKVQTGTQQKGVKEAIKEFKAGKGLRKESRKQLQKIAEGKYLPETDIKKLGKDFERAFGYSEGIFDPIRQEAIREYEQYTVPTVLSKYGSDAKSSSALNQALAASAMDLQSSIASQLAPLRANLAQNLLSQQQSNVGTGLQARLASASTGLGQGYQPLQTGLSAQPFALAPKSTPFWQQLVLGGVEGGAEGAGKAAATAAFL